MEVNASIFWARLSVRGSESMASTVTLRAARLCISSGFCAGQMKLMRVCPSRIRPTSAMLGARTLKMMSALAQTSPTTSAPAARYVSSAKFAASPAPDCTATRKPSLISFSTTSGTLATRFSPTAVSRGTPINWGIDWGGILACRPGSFLTSVNPGQPAEAPLDEFEGALHQERERRGRNRACEQRHVVIQREAGGDALAVAARADERGDGRRADVDHRGSLDAGKDGGCGERQLDQPEPLATPKAERHGGLPHAAADRQQPGTRIAHDRQQRIEEERDQRGKNTDRADGSDQECEKRERRNRLDHADDAKDHLRSPRQLGGRNAERDADHDARDEGDEHEQEVLARQAPEVGTEQRADEIALRAARLTEEEPCRLGEGLTLELRRRIHADHQARIDAPFEPRELGELARQASRQVGAVEKHGVVAREELPVILEQTQLEALDLGVGRVDVHDVDAAGGDRLVGEAMVEARRRLRQRVRRFHSRLSIRAADELLGKAELQLRVPGELGELRDGQGLCAILAHGERIAVVEAERHAGLESLPGERAIELRQRRAPGQADDLGGDGPGVFGVDVDRACLERGEHDSRITESRLVFAAGGAREDLAEDVGLGETLRADLDAILRLRRAGQREQQNNDRGFQEVMRSTSTRQS